MAESVDEQFKNLIADAEGETRELAELQDAQVLIKHILERYSEPRGNMTIDEFLGFLEAEEENIKRSDKK